MCYAPVKILNNSRFYKKGIDPLYKEVPCGKCFECKQRLQNDWLVRLYYQMNETNNNGGMTVFFTLTFNDDMIPDVSISPMEMHVVSDWLVKSREISEVHEKMLKFENTYSIAPEFYQPAQKVGFSRKYLQEFVKSFRQRLNNYHVYDYQKQSVSPVRFFFAQEYGELYHRPHSHVLAFLPFKYDLNKLLDLFSKSWSVRQKFEDVPEQVKLIALDVSKGSEMWLSSHTGWSDWLIKRDNIGRVYYSRKRGNVAYSAKNPPLVSSAKGIEYVTKYVTKRSEFVCNENFKILADWLKFFPSVKFLKDLGNDKLADIILKLRDLFPFVHCSNNVGLQILREFEFLSDREIAEMLNTRSIEIPLIERKMRVPAYIVNRVMYRPDDYDNTLRVLTPIGLASLKFRAEKKLDEIERNICDAFSVNNKMLSPEDVINLKKKYGNDCFSVAINNDLFARYSYHDVAMYVMAYRNVECPFALLHSLTLDCARDSFDDLVTCGLDKTSSSDKSPLAFENKALPYIRSNTFNYCKCFESFDLIYDLAMDINNLIRRRKAEQNRKLFLDRSQVRSFFEDYFYVN